MAFVNRVCDKVYVINLEKDKERLQSIDKQMKKNNVQYERFNAILGSKVLNDDRFTDLCKNICTDGAKGCALSHHSIWEDALKNNYQNILICEDDAMIPDTFDRDFQNIWYHVPDDYDILYFGSIFGSNDDSLMNKTFLKINGFEPKVVNEKILKIGGTVGLHCYMLSSKCIKKIINEKINDHIDADVKNWIKKYNLNAYTVNPQLVDSSQDNSSLSDTYPKVLNSLLRPIKINNLKHPSTLDWGISENFFKIGPFNINILIMILFLLMFLIPFKYVHLVYLWLLVEFVFSLDIKNTFRYVLLLSIPVGIRYLSLSLNKKKYKLF